MTDSDKIARLSGNDGISHINIYSKAETVLGRWLSHFAKQPIDLDKHGYFESIEGYWYWLKLRDNKLRYFSGTEAKQYGRSLEKAGAVPALPSDESKFRFYVMQANYEKLRANPTMANNFKYSKLIFEHYYSFGGQEGFERRITLLPQHSWITDFWTNLRNEFVNKQDIDLIDLELVRMKTFDQIKSLDKSLTTIQSDNDAQANLF